MTLQAHSSTINSRTAAAVTTAVNHNDHENSSMNASSSNNDEQEYQWALSVLHDLRQQPVRAPHLFVRIPLKLNESAPCLSDLLLLDEEDHLHQEQELQEATLVGRYCATTVTMNRTTAGVAPSIPLPTIRTNAAAQDNDWGFFSDSKRRPPRVPAARVTPKLQQQQRRMQCNKVRSWSSTVES
jgi:hypothetical protein